ncbi:MAG: glycosyltransferase family 4 protein [Candidatus Binatia bacterium]
MNILVCTHSWVTETSGVGSVLANLCEYLRSRGHTVIVLQAGDSKTMRQTRAWGGEAYELNLRPPTVPGRPVKSLAGFAVLLPATVGRLMRLLATRSIDVVNVHFPDESFVYLAICRQLRGARLPLVTSIHGADLFPDGRERPSYSPSIRAILASSDAIVAPSRSFLEDTRAIFPHHAQKLVCIHNGIRVEELAAATAPTRLGRYLVSVAMHVEKKGLDTLIRAFARVAVADSGLKLRLAGDGPLGPMLADLADELGLSDRVEFLGRQSQAQVASLLKGAEIFVLPSRAEPFGVSLLEAAACRKPIVASAVGGIPEIIADGVGGLLVPPDDVDALSAAMLRLIERPEIGKAFGESAYQTVSTRFTGQAMGARYESLLSGLVGDRTVATEGIERDPADARS